MKHTHDLKQTFTGILMFFLVVLFISSINPYMILASDTTEEITEIECEDIDTIIGVEADEMLDTDIDGMEESITETYEELSDEIIIEPIIDSEDCMVEEAQIRPVAEGTLTVTPDVTNIKLDMNESAVLAVTASTTVAEGTLVYHWYEINKENNNITGGINVSWTLLPETSANLTVTATKTTSYKCVVTDGISTFSSIFGVQVNSGLTAQANGADSYQINAGESVDLSVTASTNIGVLTYQWYHCLTENYGSYRTEIKGATQNSVAVSEVGTYECVVSDGVNQQTIYFTVKVISDFTIESPEYSSSLVNRVINSFETDPDVPVTLSVKASAADEASLTYAWYQEVPNDNDYGVSVKLMQNQTSNQISAPGVSAAYRCVVSDGYDKKTVYFEVSVESGLTVNAPSSVSVKSGSAANLAVTASSECSESFQYCWYELATGDSIGDELTYGALIGTEATLSVPNVTAERLYQCTVSDGYNRETVFISVVVDGEDSSDSGLELENAPILSYDNPMSVSMTSSESSILKIIPTVSGTHTFSVADDIAVIGYLCDANLFTLISNEDTEGEDFNITYDLTAGQVYYLIVDLYEDSPDSIPVAFVLHKPVSTECSHSWGTGTITTPATCSETGIRTYTCADCMETKTEIIKADGHVYSEAWTVDKAATCKTEGEKSHHCTVCRNRTDITVVPVLEHSWSSWETTSEATVFAAQTQQRTCGTCDISENRTVGQKLQATIKLNVKKILLKKKQSTSLVTVSGLANGDSVVAWKSSNTKIVKVNSSGKITAQKKTGKADITITLASGLTKKIPVTVQKSAVKTTKITGLSSKLTLKAGNKITLKPTIQPITSLEKVKYTSSDKEIVTVNSKGIITAKKSGKAKITVKSGKKKFVVTVTVSKVAPTKITGVKSTLTLKKGRTVTLKPKLSPKGAEAKITYKSSNKNIVAVNSKGKVKAKKKGTAIITVKAGKITHQCTVTVK